MQPHCEARVTKLPMSPSSKFRALLRQTGIQNKTLNSVENKARDFPLGLSIYLRKLVFSHTLWNVFLRNWISLSQVCALAVSLSRPWEPSLWHVTVRTGHPILQFLWRVGATLQCPKLLKSSRHTDTFAPFTPQSQWANRGSHPNHQEELHVTNGAVQFPEGHLLSLWRTCSQWLSLLGRTKRPLCDLCFCDLSQMPVMGQRILI